MSRTYIPNFSLATWLAVAAGIIYNSWILGYWLNPIVGREGLASELEGLHQPYNWVFIAGDVISSFLIIGIAAAYYRRARIAHKKRWILAAMWNVIAFGIGTIADTLLPEGCSPTKQVCPSFTHDHLLLAHGIFSIGASLALFAALFILWWHQRRNHQLSAVMVGYTIFGLISLVALFVADQSNWPQHYYIILCGIWIAMTPSAFERVLALEAPTQLLKKVVPSSSGGKKPSLF
jgi:hypothetical protein